MKLSEREVVLRMNCVILIRKLFNNNAEYRFYLCSRYILIADKHESSIFSDMF